MTRVLNVDFYKITISEDKNANNDFELILEKVKNMPPKDRLREVRTSPIFLHSIDCGWNECWEGNIIRLRMNILPIKGNFSGDIVDIDLADDEGIGEETAFIYNPETRILALQSNQHGLSLMNFARYFELIINCSDVIYLDPVLQVNAFERLEKIDKVSKINFRVAEVENMNLFPVEQHGVKKVLELSEYLQAPTMNIEISRGRGKENSFSVKKAKEMIKSLSRLNQNQQKSVKTLRISGSSSENEKIYVDLLKDKMRERVNIKDPSKLRNIPYSEKKSALREAWNRRKDEIISLYKP